ncbi:MAG: hypothetical protein ISS32_01675, partial [Candidatus Omnitrophica bacterium]|nr:hypothetical protein [Candidatus Omnitrophota bacterium]
MAKSLLVLALVFYGIFLIGCGKKEAPVDEYREAISIEELSVIETPAPQVPEANAVEIVPLPPQGPYKPTAQEIQKALKNAGFYAGEIDGKIGPMS